MPEVLADHAGLGPAEHAALLAMVRAHHGLDDIFAWGRAQDPPVHPADVVKQDEFTHECQR